MAFPLIPDTITPAQRDALFTAVGMDPAFAISMTVTNSQVSVEFLATDDNDKLFWQGNNIYVNYDTVLVQED